MILHQNTLISLEIIQNKFFCHTEKCRGACCVEGDYGAPLDESEVAEISDHIDLISEYMKDEAKEYLQKYGFYEKDPYDVIVTNCLEKADCIFCFHENQVARCAIEKAYTENKIRFRKPISCHLYPIRISRMESYDALNYHEWSICASGRVLGDKLGMPLYRFLKDALIRKFGKKWYDELEEIAEEFNKEGTGI